MNVVGNWRDLIDQKPRRDKWGRVLCQKEDCEKPMNPDGLRVLSVVVGLAENRSGGGAHGIIDRHDVGLWWHKECWKYGDQESLW